MNILAIIILLICVASIVGIIFILVNDKNKSSGKSQSNHKKVENATKINKEKKVNGHVTTLDSQDILDFKEIIVCNEEIGLVLYDNNTYVGLIEVQGINFNLLSINERLMLEENFGELLNGIDFPTQIYIQSRKIDLDQYIYKYNQNIDKLKKEIKAMQDREENKDVINNKITNLKYGENLLNYFIQRTVNAKILERKYFIVIKYTYNYTTYEHNLNDYEILTAAYSDLSNKAALIIDTLTRDNLESKLLSASGLGEVLYSAYNRDCASELKFKNAINANYNHLFTTSKPVELKILEQEIITSTAKEEELIKDLEKLQKEMEVSNNGIL